MAQERTPERDAPWDRERPGEELPPPETERHPAPGVTHEAEPDAENIIPIDDGPGTL